MILRRPRGLKAMMPETAQEFDQWREQGLIAFGEHDTVDHLIAEVLSVVRRHLETRLFKEDVDDEPAHLGHK